MSPRGCGKNAKREEKGRRGEKAGSERSREVIRAKKRERRREGEVIMEKEKERERERERE